MRVHLCGSGWRLPVRAGAVFEIFDEAHSLCLKLDAAMFLDFLAVQLRTARWVAAIAAEPLNALAMERLELEIDEPPVLTPPEARKPLAEAAPRDTVARRAALREQRRARKK